MASELDDLVTALRRGPLEGTDESLLLEAAASDVAGAALALAREVHEGQVRANGTQYVAHPIRVARLTAAVGCDDDLIAAALLHDVVEDSDLPLATIEERFGDRVAAIVGAVSAAKPAPGETREERRLRKLAKLERLRTADDQTLLVHACDVLDNAISWRYLRPEHEAWAKIPRWVFQLREYQVGLIGPRCPAVGVHLVDELRFEVGRGLVEGSWEAP